MGGAYAEVVGGDDHTCGIETGGSIKCIGLAGPATSPPAGAYHGLAAGQDFTCALDAANAIVCWGDDTFGQSSPPAGDFVQIDSSPQAYTGCGILRNKDSFGEVVCWGSNAYGQLDVPTVPPK
jgi:hypothetical protein